nr:MAG TPA_asm: hypothetical protein [Caudoviricetes sp.]
MQTFRKKLFDCMHFVNYNVIKLKFSNCKPRMEVIY